MGPVARVLLAVSAVAVFFLTLVASVLRGEAGIIAIGFAYVASVASISVAMESRDEIRAEIDDLRRRLGDPGRWM